MREIGWRLQGAADAVALCLLIGGLLPATGVM